MPEHDYARAFGVLTEGPNLLQSAQEAQQLQASSIATEAARRQLQARDALGPILQGAIDPKTGQLDYNKAFIGMAQNPDTAWMAPEFLDKAIAREGTQRESALKAFDLAMKQQDVLANTAVGLIGSKTPITKSSVLAAVAERYAENPDLFSKQQLLTFQQLIAATPEGAPLERLVRQVGIRSTAGVENMKKVASDITWRDTGAGLAATQEFPFAPPGQQVGVVGGLGKQLPPEKSEELIKHRGPTGQEELTPRSQLFPQREAPTPAALGGKGEGGAITSSPNAPVVSELPPAKAKMLEKFGEGFDKIQEDLHNDDTMEQSLGMVEKLLPMIDTNAGAEVRKKAAEYMRAIGVDKKTVDAVAGGKAGSLDAMQAVQSVLLDLATNRMARALAGGGRFTNIEFQSFVNAKPNLAMNPDAIKTLIKHYRRGIALDRVFAEHYGEYVNRGDPVGFTKHWNKVMESYAKRRAEVED